MMNNQTKIPEYKPKIIDKYPRLIPDENKDLEEDPNHKKSLKRPKYMPNWLGKVPD